DFARNKPHGRHGIRWQSVHLRTASGTEPFTLVEIVNDDMPFLVDSILNELQARGLSAELILHPILTVQRSGRGEPDRLRGPGARDWAAGPQESWIVVLLDVRTAEAANARTETLSAVRDEVRLAVTGWHSMPARFDRATSALEST